MRRELIGAGLALVASTAALADMDIRDTTETMTFHEEKTVEVRGHGDYRHEYEGGGTSNFRLRDGEVAERRVMPGDKLHKTEGTLPND